MNKPTHHDVFRAINKHITEKRNHDVVMRYLLEVSRNENKENRK